MMFQNAPKTLQELALAARKKAVKKQITRNAVDRLVEDLISGSVCSKFISTGNVVGSWVTINSTTVLLLPGKRILMLAIKACNIFCKSDNIFSESMAKGDFDNLKGSGKPLPERRAGAHVITDFTRHKVAKDCVTIYTLWPVH